MSVQFNETVIIKGDPVLYFFYNKLRLSPISIGILFALLTIVLIIWANISGVWYGGDEFKNTHYFLRSSWHTWIGNFLLACANFLIISFYIALPKLIENIYNNNVIAGDKKNLEEIYDSIFAREKFYWVYLVTLIASIEIAWLLQSLWFRMPQ